MLVRTRTSTPHCTVVYVSLAPHESWKLQIQYILLSHLDFSDFFVVLSKSVISTYIIRRDN